MLQVLRGRIHRASLLVGVRTLGRSFDSRHPHARLGTERTRDPVSSDPLQALTDAADAHAGDRACRQRRDAPKLRRLELAARGDEGFAVRPGGSSEPATRVGFCHRCSNKILLKFTDYEIWRQRKSPCEMAETGEQCSSGHPAETGGVGGGFLAALLRNGGRRR